MAKIFEHEKKASGDLDFLGDRYSGTSELGAGGMGRVYKTYDNVLQKWVAIKVMASTRALDSEAIRFQREAKAMSQLEHANIVSVMDFGVGAGGQLYLVMEYVEGRTLSELIKQRGAFPLGQAIQIFYSIVDGMVHAHSKGVIHRDLKPANILIGEDGSAKILDFGIAKELNVDDSTLTGTG